MHRATSRAAVLVLAVSASACNPEYPNPFVEGERTVVPDADAALVLSSGLWSTRAGAPRDVFSLRLDGASPTRLTFCGLNEPPCDTVEPVPSPDRRRMVFRRSGGAGESLVYVDLQRSAEAEIVPPIGFIAGADWSPLGGILVFAGAGLGDVEDLYRVEPNGQGLTNLTVTADVRERRPRIDPSASVAAYERLEADGKGRIAIFIDRATYRLVTQGGPGSEGLAGTPWVVGTDTDPDFSPDGGSIVFRRLTGTGNGGLGTWDLATIGADAANLSVIASGPVYRGAPDWGPLGIVFTEIDAAAGQARVVLVAPDGSDRRVLLTQGAAFGLGIVRWLM